VVEDVEGELDDIGSYSPPNLKIMNNEATKQMIFFPVISRCLSD
jgi:hypothetical protein